MLANDKIEAAAQTLSDHWRAGTKLATLDTAQRPHSRKEGYAIQAELEKSGKLFGWKIAATSKAPEIAGAFIRFISSSSAAGVLKATGFVAVKEN